MTWIPLLLADRSPCLRIRVLRDLLEKHDSDDEVAELRAIRDNDSLAAPILSLQKENGGWENLSQAGYRISEPIWATAAALMRLSYLGYEKNHSAMERGVEYLVSQQNNEGSWPLQRVAEHKEEGKDKWTMSPMQTSFPLQAIAMSGYAESRSAEEAYEWLMEQQLEDGTWPAGKVGDVFVRIAGYRRLPHSKWGCRTNTTQALLCLSEHPRWKQSEEAKAALDHILGRETRERQNLGFAIARYVGLEPHRGVLTYHARFDPALIAELCAKIGANRTDPRVDDLLHWIKEQQGEYGLWEYSSRPEASRWVTFGILKILSEMDENSDWISTKPRKHFTAYPRREKRF